MKNKKVNIFIADDVHAGGISLLKKYFTVCKFDNISTQDLIRSISKLQTINNSTNDCLMVRSTRIIDKKTIRILSRKTSIKLIVTVSAGFDNIDITECRNVGIDVMNVAGGNSTSAAEFTFALILNAAKSILPAHEQMKKGKFNASLYNNFELAGKTIGIIGVGNVGSKVAKLAKAFGMRILGNDINSALKKKYEFVDFVGLNVLLKNSDIVTIHTPLDESTRNLINSRNFKLIRTHGILINASRGGTIDEKALIQRLKRGKLLYAGVDVFESEPRFNKDFTKLPNVILSPHLAGKTKESKERMSLMAAEKIIKYFSKGRKSDKLLN